MVRKTKTWPWSGSVVAALALVAAFAIGWWQVARVDRMMRCELLDRARLLAQSLDLSQVQALSGDASDLSRPAFRRLHKQLAAAYDHQGYTSICLLGYRTNSPVGRTRDVFVYVDVQYDVFETNPPRKPGEVYEKSSDDLRAAFGGGNAFVEGPRSTRWGTHVSAFVPLRVGRTGEVIAVLGLDTEAAGWYWSIGVRSALPIALASFIAIGIAARCAMSRRQEPMSKPVLKRLLIPLSLLTALIVAGALGLLLYEYRSAAARRIGIQAKTAGGGLRKHMRLRAEGMTQTLMIMSRADCVRQLLRNRNSEKLQSHWGPLFETMRREHGIDRCSVLTTDLADLMFTNGLETPGNVHNTFTLREAERTGRTATGLEIESSGLLSMIAVQPVFDGNALLGYLELRAAINDILSDLANHFGVQLALLIDKKHLDRAQWEKQKGRSGCASNWDRLPDSVVIHATRGNLPEAFSRADMQCFGDTRTPGGVTDIIPSKERTWHISDFPVRDASGTEIGSLLTMIDMTNEHRAFIQRLLVNAAVGGILFTAIIAFTYVILKRTDEVLKRREERLRAHAQCLLAFGDDTEANIGKITELCGKTLQADCALYNRLQDGLPHSVGQWQAATGVRRCDYPDNHACADIIHRNEREPVVLHDLPYPADGCGGASVAVRETQTYVGMAVRNRGEVVGALSVLYRKKTQPSQEQLSFLRLASFAVAVEERRRQTTTRLRESEQTHRLLAENTELRIAVHEIVLDETGTPVDYVFLTANPAFEQQTGLRKTDIIGKRITEVLPGIEDTPFIEIYGKVVITGEPATFEQYSKPLRRHYRVNAYSMGGKRFATVFNDITARINAEHRERQQSGLRALLMDIASTYINLSMDEVAENIEESLKRVGEFCGADCVYIFRFDFAAEMCVNTHEWCAPGVEPQINKRQTVSFTQIPDWVATHRRGDVLHVADVSALPPENNLRQFLEEQAVKAMISVPMIAGDRCLGCIGFDAVHDAHEFAHADEELLRIIAQLMVNVEERYRTDTLLQTSESRLRALLQNMPQGVHVADVKTGRFTWANGALLELLGYDWQEIEALSVMDLHPPEVHQLVTEKFQQSLHDKSPFTVQVPVKRKDGAIRTVMLKSAGLQLDGRDCAIAIFTDITQRVKAENTLHTAHLQLEQVLARLNDSAGEVQRALLVNPPPHACPRLDVASRVVPAENVGGDFCDFMPHREECLDLVVGDVMGKGMASGLVAASIVGNCLRIIAGMLMNSARPDWIPSPSEIVESLHSLMARELIVLDKFASLCYARVVPEKRQAALVNCGHQQTIHYCAARGVCELVENTNMPIGFAMREHYLERRLDIDADDILVFYSDGITEARAPNRKMFGVHRLIRTVEKTADESAETIMDAIFGKLTSFSGDEQQRDDRMCIVIKVRSVTSSPPRTIVETTVDSTPEQLRTLRKKLGGALKRPEFKTLSAKDRQLLLLAVQEAGSNIIQHAYGGASGNPITLCLDLLDRALRVTLIHKGIAFMGKASKQPEDMDDFQETGYGLQIIENAVDNYRFFTDSTGKNCICLTKHMQQARARTPEKNVRLSAGT